MRPLYFAKLISVTNYLGIRTRAAVVGDWPRDVGAGRAVVKIQVRNLP
jgi:hypothetical protein